MNIVRNSLVLVFFTLAVSACSVSKGTHAMKKDIRGEWVLQTITTEGITGVAKTTIFNEAEFGCFIGSEWQFNSGTNLGSYILVDKSKDCIHVKRAIRWTFQEPQDLPKQLQFNRLDEMNNIINETGYLLTVTELDEAHMKLRSEQVFDGHSGAIIYNFVRK